MTNESIYDVGIAGGGLAGLALSIQLSKKGHRVILFEKEKYPFHKVCGEYISLESWNFLNRLGVDLALMKVPIINQLEISAINGNLIKHKLPLGGFGISRYLLDNTLAKLARANGVIILENTIVRDIVFDGSAFAIKTSNELFFAKTVCGCFGKRSNLDIKWGRPFSTAIKNKLNNYIGVKYHVQGNFPEDSIALHNFKKGYCGLVKIENDLYNLCYLTSAANLQKVNGDIKEMEKTILGKNPQLKKIFSKLNRTHELPLTISQISFDKKSQIENHILMIGDAAGMITPLCGNGMSMALHASKLAAALIHDFLTGKISREEMEYKYTLQWQQQFAKRLQMGRRVQQIFSYTWLTSLFLAILKPFPFLINSLIKKTHGQSF